MESKFSPIDLLISFLTSMHICSLAIFPIVHFIIYSNEPTPTGKIIIPLTVCFLSGILSFFLDKKPFKDKKIFYGYMIAIVLISTVIISVAIYIPFYLVFGVKSKPVGGICLVFGFIINIFILNFLIDHFPIFKLEHNDEIVINPDDSVENILDK